MLQQERKNPYEDCRSHAAETARSGRGISECPYRNNPYKSVWLKVFWTEAQIDWVDDQVDSDV